MRSIRTLTIGLALLALLPVAASAQEGRYFVDSWFWGVKGGMMLFNTPRFENAGAPLIGAEWLITKSKGALYVSLDQSFFNKESIVPADFAGTTSEIVDTKNLRRATFAVMGFPKQFGSLRPYVGAGLTLNFVQESTPQNEFASDTAFFYAEEWKSSPGALFIVGVQHQMRRFSVFGQASYSPQQHKFVLGNGATYFFEGGLRYNIGSAVDRP